MSTFDPVADLLRDLASLLAERQIQWYLFGAQAVVLWGRPRLTADVDVTVAIEPEQSLLLVAALEAAGFELRIRHDVAGFVARTRVLPFLHRHSGIQLDVVLAGPGLESLHHHRRRIPCEPAKSERIKLEDGRAHSLNLVMAAKLSIGTSLPRRRRAGARRPGSLATGNSGWELERMLGTWVFGAAIAAGDRAPRQGGAREDGRGR